MTFNEPIRRLRRLALADDLSMLTGNMARRLIDQLDLPRDERDWLWDRLAFLWVDRDCDKLSVELPLAKIDWFEELRQESPAFIILQLDVQQLDDTELQLIKSVVLYRLNVLDCSEETDSDSEVAELGMLLMMLISRNGN